MGDRERKARFAAILAGFTGPAPGAYFDGLELKDVADFAACIVEEWAHRRELARGRDADVKAARIRASHLRSYEPIEFPRTAETGP